MTDLEITRLCAEAMGCSVFERAGCLIARNGEYDFMRLGPDGGPFLRRFDPLHDDAQAMALVKKFKLHQEWSEGRHGDHWQALCWDYSANRWTEIERHTDLNRAICECVAKMQKAKT